MWIGDYIRRWEKARDFLQRVSDGDEKVLPEIEAFLNECKEQEDRANVKREEQEQKRAKRATVGRKNSGKYRIAPRLDRGVDHSATGIILLEKGEDWLVWRSGGKYWSGISRQTYAPADLEIRRQNFRDCIDLTRHHADHKPAERLNADMLKRHQKKINEIFGPGATAKAVQALKTGTMVIK